MTRGPSTYAAVHAWTKPGQSLSTNGLLKTWDIISSTSADVLRVDYVFSTPGGHTSTQYSTSTHLQSDEFHYVPYVLAAGLEKLGITSTSSWSSFSNTSAPPETSSTATSASLETFSSSQTEPSTSAAAASSSGSSLSIGAKAGIGVGVSIGGLVLLAIVSWILVRRRQRHRRSEGVLHSTTPELSGEDTESKHAGAGALSELDESDAERPARLAVVELDSRAYAELEENPPQELGTSRGQLKDSRTNAHQSGI